MTSIELSVSPDYVEWGIWEALRELMQNARDAHDRGHTMGVEYYHATKSLVLVNTGVTLGRETLVLGGTTKRNDDAQRGQFGEGYKLALATLLRNGCEIKIISGNEQWIPSIDYSHTFKSNLLKINVSETESFYDGICFFVKGITSEQYTAMQKRLLFLSGKEGILPKLAGKILKSKEYKNKLFVRDIYVNEMDEPCYFGYNLRDVLLNRDRTLANPHFLKASIVKTLSDAVLANHISIEDLFNVMYQPIDGNGSYWFEETAIRNCYYNLDGTVVSQLADFFINKFGPRAVPVTQLAQMNEAGYYGKKGVYVPPGLSTVLSLKLGSFQDMKDREELTAIKMYPFEQLDAEERQNLHLAACAVNPYERLCGLPSFDHKYLVGACDVTVVDFTGPMILGSFRFGGPETNGIHTVRIARKILKNLPELIATLIHEVSHKYGKDGTVEHLTAIETLNGKILAGILRKD